MVDSSMNGKNSTCEISLANKNAPFNSNFGIDLWFDGDILAIWM